MSASSTSVDLQKKMIKQQYVQIHHSPVNLLTKTKSLNDGFDKHIHDSVTGLIYFPNDYIKVVVSSTACRAKKWFSRPPAMSFGFLDVILGGKAIEIDTYKPPNFIW